MILGSLADGRNWIDELGNQNYITPCGVSHPRMFEVRESVLLVSS